MAGRKEHQYFRRKKRKQLSTGSTQTNRFERILMSIGSEPHWIRSKIHGAASSPALTTLLNRDDSTRARPSSISSLGSPTSLKAAAPGHENAQLLNVEGSVCTDRSSAQLIVHSDGQSDAQSDAGPTGADAADGGTGANSVFRIV